MKKRYADWRTISFLKQAAEGMPIKERCRKHGFSDASLYLWRRRFGGMDVPDAKRLRKLEAENGELKGCWPMRCWARMRLGWWCGENSRPADSASRSGCDAGEGQGQGGSGSLTA